MAKLSQGEKNNIRYRVMETTFADRKAKLVSKEHDIAMYIMEAIFGENVFMRIRDVPQGWLPTSQSVHFKTVSAGRHVNSYTVNFEENRQIPASAVYSSTELDENHPAVKAFLDLKQVRADMNAEHRTLDARIQDLLNSFSTHKQLEEGWPEGFAALRRVEVVKNLPSVTANTVNALIEKAKTT
jgi:hypothetical protein